MKQERDSKKTDAGSVTPPVNDGEGIDALKALQVIAGFLCFILLVWIIFHSLLHVF